MAETTICSATRKDGRPCLTAALPSSAFCFAHDPAHASARRKGGEGNRAGDRAFRMLPSKLRPVFSDLKDLYRECHDGTIDVDRARACAAIARAMVAVLAAGQLEERLQAIEGQMVRAAEERQSA